MACLLMVISVGGVLERKHLGTYRWTLRGYRQDVLSAAIAASDRSFHNLNPVRPVRSYPPIARPSEGAPKQGRRHLPHRVLHRRGRSESTQRLNSLPQAHNGEG